MDKLNGFLNKLLSLNFNNSSYKYFYIYNELFISILQEDDFVLFGITFKSGKLSVGKYVGGDTKLGIKLQVIIKKFDNILNTLLKDLNKNNFNIGEEVEFINIFDREELGYEEVEKRLDFSFLDDYAYRRKSHYNFSFSSENSVLDIYHSDFECSKCNGPKQSFNNFPDFSKTFDPRYFQEQGQGERKKTSYLYTNITDYESITLGGNEKINDILKDKKLLDKYDLISLNKTCISVIMGDDIKSIFEHNKVDPKKIFYTDQNTDSPYRAVINYFKGVSLNNELKKKNKNKVIFFGLNKSKNTYEIIELLQDNFGIKVDKVLIPNIKISDLNDILSYRLGVFFEGREVRAQNIFKLYPFPQMESKIPYGITNFRNLFENILINTGKKKLISKLDSIILANKKKNTQLYKDAKKCSIGFIIYDLHIKSFINDNFRGISILSLLDDMGFNIKFYIYSQNERLMEDINEFKKKKYNIIVSSNKDELQDFILDKNIQLYYSELLNDTRILSHNKEQFSIGDLEYGIEGFYRTFNKLVKKCNKVKYLKELVNI